jgi:hypothetical protein
MCYALSVVDMNQVCSHSLSLSYIPANLFVYLLRPLSIKPDFPFIFINWIKETDFPFFINLPAHLYYSDPVVGAVFSMPFSLLFAAMAGVQAFRKLLGQDREKGYLVIGILLAALMNWGFLLLFFALMLRYVADFSILLTLAAIMGFWTRLQDLEKRTFLRFMTVLVALSLVLWGVGVGFLTGISGTSNVFYEANPTLFNTMKGWFDIIIW